MPHRLRSFWKRAVEIYRREIWSQKYIARNNAWARLYAVLRVVSITISSMLESNVFSRAASLSFSTMLGLGPLVALAVMVAGFMLDRQDPETTANALSVAIERIVPPLQHYDAGDAAATEAGGALANPELVKMIDGFIDASKSGAVGAFGVLTLIVIVIQLFTSIEQAFNNIWGVQQGRSWLMRIVFYWSVLTLGALLFFASITGLSASALINAIQSTLPYGVEVAAGLRFFLPLISVMILVGMLTVFYRVVPNTHVWWRAAVIGAVLVVFLLIINNYLAFLYLKRVMLQKSLYGSLGLIMVIMAGLYVFWLFILIGGHLSYAVQNANFRNTRTIWSGLSFSVRERLSLVVLLVIARRFAACEAPYRASDLGGLLKVPMQILNESLSRLVMMKFLVPIPPEPGEPATDYRYQPGKPLNKITLAEFRKTEADCGTEADGDFFPDIDSLSVRYIEKMAAMFSQDKFFNTPLEQLIREFPSERIKNKPAD